MRFLRPSPNGIVETKCPAIYSGGLQLYTQPSKSLTRIDRIRSGEKPRIVVQRKMGGIGDVLMTLPTVKAISKKYDVKVIYATDFEYHDGALQKVLQHNPYIDKVIPAAHLVPEDWDAVVELTCPCISHELPKAKPINRIDLFARHAGLQIPLDDPSIDYFVQPEEDQWAQEYLKNAGFYASDEIIFVQPCSYSVRRDPPADKLRKALSQILSERRNAKALIITHYTDHNRFDWNIRNSHLATDVYVRQIAALMKKSSLVVCPDSSILHLASALHLKTLTLFGPTDPYARVNYHPEAVAVWPAKQLCFSPTWYDASADPSLLCWKVLNEHLIIDTALAILDNRPIPPSNDLVTFG